MLTELNSATNNSTECSYLIERRDQNRCQTQLLSAYLKPVLFHTGIRLYSYRGQASPQPVAQAFDAGDKVAASSPSLCLYVLPAFLVALVKRRDGHQVCCRPTHLQQGKCVVMDILPQLWECFMVLLVVCGWPNWSLSWCRYSSQGLHFWFPTKILAIPVLKNFLVCTLYRKTIKILALYLKLYSQLWNDCILHNTFLPKCLK